MFRGSWQQRKLADARNGLQERRLPRTRGPHNRHQLTRLEVTARAIQNPTSPRRGKVVPMLRMFSDMTRFRVVEGD